MAKLNLEQFTGSEEFYPVGEFLLTEGASYLGAQHSFYQHVLASICAANKTFPKLQDEHFQVWETVTKEKTASISMRADSDQPILFSVEIASKNGFPEPVTLWKVDNVIMLPSEY